MILLSITRMIDARPPSILRDVALRTAEERPRCLFPADSLSRADQEANSVTFLINGFVDEKAFFGEFSHSVKPVALRLSQSKFLQLVRAVEAKSEILQFSTAMQIVRNSCAYAVFNRSEVLKDEINMDFDQQRLLTTYLMTHDRGSSSKGFEPELLLARYIDHNKYKLLGILGFGLAFSSLTSLPTITAGGPTRPPPPFLTRLFVNTLLSALFLGDLVDTLVGYPTGWFTWMRNKTQFTNRIHDISDTQDDYTYPRRYRCPIYGAILSGCGIGSTLPNRVITTFGLSLAIGISHAMLRKYQQKTLAFFGCQSETKRFAQFISKIPRPPVPEKFVADYIQIGGKDCAVDHLSNYLNLGKATELKSDALDLKTGTKENDRQTRLLRQSMRCLLHNFMDGFKFSETVISQILHEYDLETKGMVPVRHEISINEINLQEIVEGMEYLPRDELARTMSKEKPQKKTQVDDTEPTKANMTTKLSKPEVDKLFETIKELNTKLQVEAETVKQSFTIGHGDLSNSRPEPTGPQVESEKSNEGKTLHATDSKSKRDESPDVRVEKSEVVTVHSELLEVESNPADALRGLDSTVGAPFDHARAPYIEINSYCTTADYNTTPCCVRGSAKCALDLLRLMTLVGNSSGAIYIVGAAGSEGSIGTGLLDVINYFSKREFVCIDPRLVNVSTKPNNAVIVADCVFMSPDGSVGFTMASGHFISLKDKFVYTDIANCDRIWGNAQNDRMISRDLALNHKILSQSSIGVAKCRIPFMHTVLLPNVSLEWRPYTKTGSAEIRMIKGSDCFRADPQLAKLVFAVNTMRGTTNCLDCDLAALARPAIKLITDQIKSCTFKSVRPRTHPMSTRRTESTRRSRRPHAEKKESVHVDKPITQNAASITMVLEGLDPEGAVMPEVELECSKELVASIFEQTHLYTWYKQKIDEMYQLDKLSKEREITMNPLYLPEPVVPNIIVFDKNIRGCLGAIVDYLSRLKCQVAMVLFESLEARKVFGSYTYSKPQKVRLCITECEALPEFVIYKDELTHISTLFGYPYKKLKHDMTLTIHTEMEIFISLRILSSLSTHYRNPKYLRLERIYFLDGVAGCGKSTKIRQIYRTMNGKVLILTKSRAGKEALMGTGVRTIDSFIINKMRKAGKSEVVVIDEAAMIHKGLLLLICAEVECSTLILLGDSKQIPYYSRDGLWQGEPPEFPIRPHLYRLNHTYRMPLGAAQFSSSVYASLVTTSNSIKQSIKLHSDIALDDIRKLVIPKDAVLMVMTREELDILKGMLPHHDNIYTVKTAQGKSVEHAILFRLTLNDYPLFQPTHKGLASPHLLVALTRHTKSFHYYSIMSSRKDPVIDTIQFCLRKGESKYCEMEPEIMEEFLTKVPKNAEYSLELVDVVNILNDFKMGEGNNLKLMYENSSAGRYRRIVRWPWFDGSQERKIKRDYVSIHKNASAIVSDNSQIVTIFYPQQCSVVRVQYTTDSKDGFCWWRTLEPLFNAFSIGSYSRALKFLGIRDFGVPVNFSHILKKLGKEFNKTLSDAPCLNPKYRNHIRIHSGDLSRSCKRCIYIKFVPGQPGHVEPTTKVNATHSVCYFRVDELDAIVGSMGNVYPQKCVEVGSTVFPFTEFDCSVSDVHSMGSMLYHNRTTNLHESNLNRVIFDIPVVADRVLEGTRKQLFERISAAWLSTSEYYAPWRLLFLLFPALPKSSTEPTELPSNWIDSLQATYNSVVPGLSERGQEWDQFIGVESPIYVTTDTRVRLNVGTLNTMLIDAPICDHRSKLVTAFYPPRPNTGIEQLTAVNHRNFRAPILQGAVYSKCSAAAHFTDFISTYGHDRAGELLLQYQSQPIRSSDKLTKEWIAKLPGPKVSNYLNDDKMFADELKPEYEMFLKAAAKSTGKNDILKKLPKGQVIAMMNRVLTAYFSPMFKQLVERLKSLLGPHIVLAIGYNKDTLDAILSFNLPSNEKLCYYEGDITGFDRAQGASGLEGFIYMAEQLGMSKTDMDLWRDLHVRTKVKSRQGVTAYLSYQTKSGDASTALVNTYTTMCAMTKLNKQIEPILFMAMGDDSLAVSRLDIDLYDTEFDLATRFNLSVKMSKPIVGSFCGGFIVELSDRWVYVTDIIKRMEKLGRQHNPDLGVLAEQFISFQDLLRCYDSDEIRRIAAEKIRDIQQWPAPVNPKQVRVFLGLCGYLRRHIRGYAALAKPLTKLTEKHRRFSWGPEEQAAFDRLKAALVSPPVLALPVFSDKSPPFVLDVDASGSGLGGCLMQGDRVTAYASRALTKSERQYSVTKRELLAVVWATTHFRQYLIGRRYLLRTDHSALQWLFNMKDPRGQLARWVLHLSEMEFDIVHRRGALHNDADALSRYPHKTADPEQRYRWVCVPVADDQLSDATPLQSAATAQAGRDSPSPVREAPVVVSTAGGWTPGSCEARKRAPSPVLLARHAS